MLKIACFKAANKTEVSFFVTFTMRETSTRVWYSESHECSFVIPGDKNVLHATVFIIQMPSKYFLPKNKIVWVCNSGKFVAIDFLSYDSEVWFVQLSEEVLAGPVKLFGLYPYIKETLFEADRYFNKFHSLSFEWALSCHRFIIYDPGKEYTSDLMILIELLSY